MGWGPGLSFLYNDAYRPTLGVKHPDALSRPFREVWKEVWSEVSHLVDQIQTTGEAIFSDGLLLLLERSGFPEETCHTFSYEAAMAVIESDRRIDLLFTDVVLPGRSGRMLADAALKVRPGLNVLFTTGYSRNAIVHHGRLDPGVQLISKPFTFEQLAARIRDALDR